MISTSAKLQQHTRSRVTALPGNTAIPGLHARANQTDLTFFQLMDTGVRSFLPSSQPHTHTHIRSQHLLLYSYPSCLSSISIPCPSPHHCTHLFPFIPLHMDSLFSTHTSLITSVRLSLCVTKIFSEHSGLRWPGTKRQCGKHH